MVHDAAPDETIRQVITGVYGAGVAPSARLVGSLWRWAGANPVKMLMALPATCVVALGIGCYAVAATIVPLCVALLLTMTSPVLAWVAVDWLVKGRPGHVNGTVGANDVRRVPAAHQSLAGRLDIELDAG